MYQSSQMKQRLAKSATQKKRSSLYSAAKPGPVKAVKPVDFELP
jgi:hypothetical protein